MAKKDGGFRPILDLRGLNQFLKVLPFHMLTTSDIRRVVARGEWFTTVDLKDAYFHVPIASHHQCFLRFAFRGWHFQFRLLPFVPLSKGVHQGCGGSSRTPAKTGHEGPAVFG